MVGNDIVDIHETRRSSNWERPGFLQKLFTVKEQSLIATSNDPFVTLWRLWSMKESAYKVYIQAGGIRFFNPTKIECSLISLKIGQVKIAAITLKTKTSIQANYIYSTASEDCSTVVTRIFKLIESHPKKQGLFMQEQLLYDYAKNYSLKLAHLQLKKLVTGVPVFYYKKKPLITSISITHHGKYGAYSFLKL
jgi:phosphopantetheinyl transferase (holo-ACP synthase)